MILFNLIDPSRLPRRDLAFMELRDYLDRAIEKIVIATYDPRSQHIEDLKRQELYHINTLTGKHTKLINSAKERGILLEGHINLQKYKRAIEI